MSKYYTKMSVSALRDELDRLEEDGADACVGLRNQIFYICEALCRKGNAA